MKITRCLLLITYCLPSLAAAQVPVNTGIAILKAEDARRYDSTLEGLMKSPSADIRKRAALAAGRIGNDAAIEQLVVLMRDDDTNVRVMAAFAIGEIESIKGAEEILGDLELGYPPKVKVRIVEAAGKIAAANPKTDEAKELTKGIFHFLEEQAYTADDKRDREVVLSILTATLRAKPEDAGEQVAKFLDSSDARIRADAANVLARLKDQRASYALWEMVANDKDPIARTNAARALAGAQDSSSVDALISALSDTDPRVRVSAIRSLGASKRAGAAELIAAGQGLLANYKKSKYRHPIEGAELLEIANALGRMLEGTKDEDATKFLFDLAAVDNGFSSDAVIARMKISPASFADKAKPITTWHQYSTIAQGMGAFAEIEGGTPEGTKAKAKAPETLRDIIKALNQPVIPKGEKFKLLAAPDFVQAFAAYKTSDLSEVMRATLLNKDVFVRAAAAGVLADQPSSPENVEALNAAFKKARVTDMHDNDAMLAVLDALFKIDKRAAVPTLLNALTATDYIVRKKAFDMLADPEVQKVAGVADGVRQARQKRADQVQPYDPRSGTKLGQVLNTDADYVRALSRKNGSVKAVLTTGKGTFTIEFFPEEAPLTVDNFIKLARSGYFNGLEVHRVVPNFVMQDGDPRGDGNGGPGWSIRCEINMLPYDRGAVGMALSGKDTGGSQWFVTHSPQPHLDGGYTVFGHVNESDMKVVDNIVRGDRILSVKIIGR